MLHIEIVKHFQNRISYQFVFSKNQSSVVFWIGFYCIMLLVKARSSSKIWINISCCWWKAETASGQILVHSELVLENPDERIKIKHYSPTVKIFIIRNQCLTWVSWIQKPMVISCIFISHFFKIFKKQSAKSTIQLPNQIISVSLLNMTSAAPLSVVLSLLSQRKEGKRGRSVSHV